MPDETAVVDSPEATEAISTELPDITSEEPFIEAPESAASETTEEPRSWNHEEWQEHDQFKEWFEERQREHQFEGQKREYGRYKQLRETVQTQILDQSTVLEAAVNGLTQSIREASEMGDPSAIGRELAKNPEALRAYKEAMEASKRFRTVEGAFKADLDRGAIARQDVALSMGIIEAASGVEAKSYLERFGEEYDVDPAYATQTYQRYVKAALKGAEEKGYQRGLNAGKGVSAEVQKAQERSGKAPPAAIGSAGSGRPTAAQYAAATSEQRSKWAEKGIDPLA